jgi:hypothetical protein
MLTQIKALFIKYAKLLLGLTHEADDDWRPEV